MQYIKPNGEKLFLSGGRKKGCFVLLANPINISTRLLICEGYATGASLHEKTGQDVYVAFDAGNLSNVAKIIRAGNPNAKIIIAGDNDLSEVWQKAARGAALACGGKYWIPPTPVMTVTMS